MTTYFAQVCTPNIRAMETCANDSALRSILGAVEDAADRFANVNHVQIELYDIFSPYQPRPNVIAVSSDAAVDEDDLSYELERALDSALTKAIADKAWEHDA
ncbi:MAG: hypothetical protein HQL37_10225 [Alphaproteobacteria bacterium]|nr:hypothetical protein [Alphaproteobacteria bacterium]